MIKVPLHLGIIFNSCPIYWNLSDWNELIHFLVASGIQYLSCYTRNGWEDVIQVISGISAQIYYQNKVIQSNSPDASISIIFLDYSDSKPKLATLTKQFCTLDHDISLEMIQKYENDLSGFPPLMLGITEIFPLSSLDDSVHGFIDGIKRGIISVLWIGCSDSRVPPDVLCQTHPGMFFVHRNIANVIVLSDLNACSVIQYAVETLKVRDIIICGHYGCGGVKAALSNNSFGLLDEWISHIKHNIQHVIQSNRNLDNDKLFRIATEANILESMRNLSSMPMIQDAWKRNQDLNIHGWVYDIKNGKLRDLGFQVGGRILE